jgi:hypothetical protein
METKSKTLVVFCPGGDDEGSNRRRSDEDVKNVGSNGGGRKATVGPAEEEGEDLSHGGHGETGRDEGRGHPDLTQDQRKTRGDGDQGGETGEDETLEHLTWHYAAT